VICAKEDKQWHVARATKKHFKMNLVFNFSTRLSP